MDASHLSTDNKSQNHMVREAKYAGSFYADNAKEIISSMGTFFGKYPNHLDCERIKPILAMLPHAGHIYSGDVCAKAMSEIEFAPRIIILCPNHTGAGKNLALWGEGSWQNPVGLVPVDRFMTEKLLADSADGVPSPFCISHAAHENEHSIEVILPFLQYSVPILYILPISVSNLDNIQEAAKRLFSLIQSEKAEGREVTLLVSSDMNHFADEEENRRKDHLALEAFLQRDPAALLKVVHKENISMCGVLPAILGLLVANALGAEKSKLLSYDTSATCSGNSQRVVGYAGAYVL